MSNNIINGNSIKDNFRTPLTPLHRGGRERLHMGGLGGLHGFRLNRFCNNTLRYAFSLIELSIVLIIIGLLVAGVVGGKSLIESAKTRALMNEIRGYKQAVNIYYAANGKLPGDIDGTGKIGINTDNYCPDGSCSSRWAPWYFMNKEGIVDFDNNKDILGDVGRFVGKKSNILKDVLYNYVYLNHDSTGDLFDGEYLERNSLGLEAYYFGSIPTKSMQFLDNKMDDGDARAGKILSICMNFPLDNKDIWENDEWNGGPSYEDSINEKGFCRQAYFALDI